MNYTCRACKKEFEAGWTDEEAHAEAEANFGVSPADAPEYFGVVCDNCYKKMGFA